MDAMCFFLFVVYICDFDFGFQTRNFVDARAWNVMTGWPMRISAPFNLVEPLSLSWYCNRYYLRSIRWDVVMVGLCPGTIWLSSLDQALRK
jgi:hypothetical protein